MTPLEELSYLLKCREHSWLAFGVKYSEFSFRERIEELQKLYSVTSLPIESYKPNLTE